MIKVNRSTVNVRMVPILVAALVLTLALLPGEVGETLRHFGEVALDAGRSMHDGYMRLF